MYRDELPDEPKSVFLFVCWFVWFSSSLDNEAIPYVKQNVLLRRVYNDSVRIFSGFQIFLLGVRLHRKWPC